jgi:DNA-binding NarL/FixJ family response regulator
LLKEDATEELIRAIHEVSEDKFYISPKISKYIVEGFVGKENHYEPYSKETINLTRREREILQLIAEGLNSNEISEKLNISLNTVLSHRNNIMRKLEIHSQAGLIRYALKQGIAHL